MWFALIYNIGWLPRWLSGKESACLCRKRRMRWFDPCIWKIPWRRNRNTPYSCLDNQGQRSPAGCLPWDHKELDVNEHTCMHNTEWNWYCSRFKPRPQEVLCSFACSLSLSLLDPTFIMRRSLGELGEFTGVVWETCGGKLNHFSHSHLVQQVPTDLFVDHRHISEPRWDKPSLTQVTRAVTPRLVRNKWFLYYANKFGMSLYNKKLPCAWDFSGSTPDSFTQEFSCW